jgi:cytochrome o ubiquinol oxidase subunit III
MTMTDQTIDAAEKPEFYLTEDHHPENSTNLGFWLYLMSDCLIFAVLFATHGVLGRNYAAGPSPADLFDLPIVALNTSMLLFSSITYGFAMLQMERNAKAETLFWLAVTGLFGAAFIGLELYEFIHLIHEGAGPTRSAFLSSFFTLVGTHGLHVFAGLLWLGTMMAQLWAKGYRQHIMRRLLCFSIFWHALDIIWVAIFTIVYLIGTLP